MSFFQRRDDGPYLGAFLDKRSSPGAIRYRGPKHLITIGPPGSGKSAGLVVPNVADLPRSMLIIDPKGEIAAITAKARARLGKVIVLNPFGVFADELPQLKSQGFNVMAGLDPASDSFTAEAAGLAEALISVENDHQKFFPLSARNIVTALIMWEKLQRGVEANLGADPREQPPLHQRERARVGGGEFGGHLRRLALDGVIKRAAERCKIRVDCGTERPRATR